MTKNERAAIEAVTRRFGAAWEEGGNPPDGYLVVSGKRIAVEVAEMKAQVTKNGRPARFRLRFDKVALRVVADLREGLRESVPDGKTVIVTITAPIKLASKTTEAMEEKIRRQLTRRPTHGNAKYTIHGNRIGIRVANGSTTGAKVIDFVHNPDPRAEMLLNIACALVEAIGAKARKRAELKSANGPWQIIASADEPAHVEMYRQIYSVLGISSEFEKVLMVFAGGRVETLS